MGKASSYSDSGLGQRGYPPTYQDVLMRQKHTKESVNYNLEHAEDHLAELCAQLGKLAQVDRGTANNLAHKVCQFLDRVYHDVESYKSEPDGEKGGY